MTISKGQLPPFHPAGPRTQTRVIRLISRCLYRLSQLSNSTFFSEAASPTEPGLDDPRGPTSLCPPIPGSTRTWRHDQSFCVHALDAGSCEYRVSASPAEASVLVFIYLSLYLFVLQYAFSSLSPLPQLRPSPPKPSASHNVSQHRLIWLHTFSPFQLPWEEV